LSAQVRGLLTARAGEGPVNHDGDGSPAARPDPAPDPDGVQTALADAVAAERIAAGEAAGLRVELDRLRARAPWWRRWFG
jgi:hypothetical protein